MSRTLRNVLFVGLVCFGLGQSQAVRADPEGCTIEDLCVEGSNGNYVYSNCDTGPCSEMRYWCNFRCAVLFNVPLGSAVQNECITDSSLICHCKPGCEPSEG
jgi:hypothetical protein